MGSLFLGHFYFSCPNYLQVFFLFLRKEVGMIRKFLAVVFFCFFLYFFLEASLGYAFKDVPPHLPWVYWGFAFTSAGASRAFARAAGK